MVSRHATRCPFCHQFVVFFRTSSLPLCSFCHLALAAFHCFNPQCVTGPTSTPICNSCPRTPYYLTHPICLSIAGPRPIPYHEQIPLLPLCWHTSLPSRLLVILYNSSFSSDSHVWSAAPVQLNWTCRYTNVAYKSTNIFTFPERTLQLTLHDSTAVDFHYRSTQWTEFVLFLYQLPYLPTSNRWKRIRYLNLNRHLRNLFKDPRNFQKQATQTKDRVPPVSAPPVNGRPG